jgi:uncharacterized membrane protein YraQ (UPF0718 family)
MHDPNDSAPAAGAEGRRPPMFDIGLAILLTMALGSAGLVYFRSGLDGVLEVLGSDSVLLVEVAPRMAAGVLLASFIGLLLPREAIGRHFGRESGWRGLALASLAGIVVPGGPAVVLPLAASFAIAGADRGSMTAFITSWLLLGSNRVLVWELSFFEPSFVFVRVLTSLPAPFVVGLAARYFFGSGAGSRRGP